MNDSKERLLRAFNDFRLAISGLKRGNGQEMVDAFIGYLKERDNVFYIYLNEDKTPYLLDYEGTMCACIYTSSDEMFESYLDGMDLDFRTESAYDIFRFILEHKNVQGIVINDYTLPYAYMPRDIMEMVMEAVDKEEGRKPLLTVDDLDMEVLEENRKRYLEEYKRVKQLHPDWLDYEICDEMNYVPVTDPRIKK